MCAGKECVVCVVGGAGDHMARGGLRLVAYTFWLRTHSTRVGLFRLFYGESIQCTLHTHTVKMHFCDPASPRSTYLVYAARRSPRKIHNENETLSRVSVAPESEGGYIVRSKIYAG